MIKFTMGSSGNQKTHRRKPKRNTKSYMGYQNTAGGGGLCVPAVGVKSTVLPATSLTATSTVVSSSCNASVDNSKLTFSPINSTYLQSLPRDCCLICHAPRTDNNSPPCVVSDHTTDDTACSGVGVGFIPSQLQLWMCSECRRTVEEENEKRSSRSLLDQDLMVGPPTSPTNLSSASDTEISAADAGQSCCCDSCSERRQIELQQEQETAELLELWNDLRQKLLSVFHVSDTQHAAIDSGASDNSIHDLIERFCAYDPHGLYQRIECLAREYLVKRKSCLTQLYMPPTRDNLQSVDVGQTSASVDSIVSALLHEYDGLKCISDTISLALAPLEEHHLKQFHLTVELHLQQLFRSIIYIDLQKHIPNIGQLLRSRIAVHDSEGHDSDELTNLLHRYLRFDDEMLQVAVQWRDCFQLIEQYNDEQSAVTFRQKMLHEDWEFFRSQRRLLEQQLCEHKTSNHGLDDVTTEAAMWQLLHANKADQSSHCRNYAQQSRCSCDECNIVRLVASGIVSPELTEQLSHDGAVATPTPSYCFADILPQMLTAGPADVHNQLPMMFGHVADYSQHSGTQDVIDDEYDDDDDEIETDDNIDADDSSGEMKASLYVDRHGDGQDSPDSKTDAPLAAAQQHCQCHYCYQQTTGHSLMDSAMRPFFLQPPLQASPIHSYPPHLAHSRGLVQPSAIAPPPHLYHLHCDTTVSQPPQRVPGDGNSVLTAPLSTIYHDAPQTDIMLCNGWHDTFTPLAKYPPSFTSVSGLAFATAAGTTAVIGSHTDTSCGTVASVSLANNGLSSPWNMSSPAVFSASLLPTQSASTTVQHVPRFFQPVQYLPDMAQAPVKFTNGLLPYCTSLANTAGNIGQQDSISDEPMGKRFVPCWHSVATSTASTLTVSTSPQTGIASECLDASTAISTSAGTANMFSPVMSEKPLVTKTSPTTANGVGTVARCRHSTYNNDVDDDEDEDEDDDDESVSDESSSASNQKDGGKYCECWRCEFFGHADPPTLPTSKNYPEMRERLRLRLKKKNQQHTVDIEPAVTHDVVTTSDVVHDMDVEDLLKFINGDDDKSQVKLMTRKAAKRARQKQRKAAEKLQENSASFTTHQSTSVSAKSDSLVHTAAATTMSSSTVITSAESTVDAQSKKMLTKPASSLAGTESTTRKSKAVTSVEPMTTVSQTLCSSQSVFAKAQLKQSSDKPATNKTKTSESSATSSSLTTDRSPPISVKLAKGKRGQKIGQLRDVVNSTQQSAGQISTKLPAAASSCLPSLSANSSLAVSSHTSSTKSSTTSHTEMSSKVVSQLPNGLVAHNGKTFDKADNLYQTVSATQHRNMTKPLTQLPVGLQAHADKQFAKPNHLARNGGNPQHGSKLQTDVVDQGPLSGSTDKASRKLGDVASTPLEQNGHVRVSKSAETCGRSSSLMDVSGDSIQMNAHTDQNATTTTNKGKKARRKGRGKEAQTSVDDIFLPKEVECARMDDFEREIEEFKRFCFNSTPADHREKLQVNVNIKDIFAKKKTTHVT